MNKIHSKSNVSPAEHSLFVHGQGHGGIDPLNCTFAKSTITDHGMFYRKDDEDSQTGWIIIRIVAKIMSQTMRLICICISHFKDEIGFLKNRYGFGATALEKVANLINVHSVA